MALAGCTESGPAEAELAVTEDQYRAAYQVYSACMLAAGYELVNVDDSGVVIDFSYNAEAAGNGVEEGCYEEFGPIDTAWQVQNQYDSESWQIVTNCLRDAGIEPDGTVEGEVEQLQDAGLEDECLSTPPG